MIKNAKGWSKEVSVSASTEANDATTVVASGKVLISSISISATASEDNRYWTVKEMNTCPRIVISDASGDEKFIILANIVRITDDNVPAFKSSTGEFINLPGFGFRIDDGLIVTLKGDHPNVGAWKMNASVIYQQG